MRGRPSRHFCLALSALALGVAAPAFAQSSLPQTATGVEPYAVFEMGSSSREPTVDRGDQIAIACDALKTAAVNDVSVVMRISPALGDLETGYKRVLVTDELVMNGAVRVRIPNVPDLASHTVQVNVYVAGTNGQQASCDAGTMRVG
jgi:hypothetical protein